MKVKTKMKKLMLMVAAVALAVGAQAALAVTWQTGTGVKDVSGNAFTTSVSGYTAEIMFSTASDMSSPMAVTGISATEYKTKGSAGFGAKTSASFDPGTYYAQVTITEDATGKKWTSEIGSFSIADGALSSPTINFTTGANMGGASLIGSTAYSGGGSTPDIPEPTSGLLLALGGAMLALRRRRT